MTSNASEDNLFWAPHVQLGETPPLPAQGLASLSTSFQPHYSENLWLRTTSPPQLRQASLWDRAPHPAPPGIYCLLSQSDCTPDLVTAQS